MNTKILYQKYVSIFSVVLAVAIVIFILSYRHEPYQVQDMTGQGSDKTIESNQLTQSDIADAVVYLSQTDSISLIQSTSSPHEFVFMDGHGSINIDKTATGDIDHDGHQDVILSTTWCAASCGNPFTVIINQKATYDGKDFPQKFSVFNGEFPGIETAGYARPEIVDVQIKQGLIYIKTQKDSKEQTHVYRLTSTNGTSRYMFVRCEAARGGGECVTTI